MFMEKIKHYWLQKKIQGNAILVFPSRKIHSRLLPYSIAQRFSCLFVIFEHNLNEYK